MRHNRLNISCLIMIVPNLSSRECSLIYICLSSSQEGSVHGNTASSEERKRKAPSAGKHYCCVPSCHSYDGKTLEDGTKVVMHRLPSATKYPMTRRLTLQKLKNVSANLKGDSANTRICSRHYKGEYIQGKSIPTEFPSKRTKVEKQRKPSSYVNRNVAVPNFGLDCASESGNIYLKYG